MSDDLNSLLEVNPALRTTSQPSDGFEMDASPSSGPSNFASSVMRRYRDAYLVARVTTGFGGLIKGVGILLAIVILGGALTLASQPSYGGYGDTKTMYTTVGFVMAFIVGALFYLLGILVSAQGQILKASLDSAVNSSPFMTNYQKASVMAL
jgi:hypothetical protein